tara:strand:+ start:410 stop:592 length:183 start_codon:yes stop_codon:yes gene_type:complete
MAVIKNWTYRNCDDLICKFSFEDAIKFNFEDEYLDAKQFVNVVEYDYRAGIITDYNQYDD